MNAVAEMSLMVKEMPSFKIIEHHFVDKTATCWLWSGSTNRKGYGQISYRVNGKCFTQRVHRLSHEQNIGPIPNGEVVCHTCDVRRCLRPDHLWTGTRKENNEDMARKGRHGALLHLQETHCQRGHLITGTRKPGSVGMGQRYCKECHRMAAKKRRKLQ